MWPRTWNLWTLSSIIWTIIDICTCLTFLSDSDSYAEYRTWNANVTGTLQFRFKTFKPTAVLLYIDEVSNRPEDEKSYLELSLERGSLKLVVQMGGEGRLSKKERRFRPRFSTFNDMNWHKVKILRNRSKTTVKVDQWSFEVVNQGKVDYLPVNSSLFVGGVSKMFESKIVNRRVFFTLWFVGCIEDLAYSKDETPVKPGSLLSAARVASGCVDACAAKSTEHCANGGKCLNQFSTFVCNCLGTGYEGKNCSKSSESAYFRGMEYLTWSPVRSQSVSGHHIIIRFKTYLENGILFTAGSKRDFLILEVYKGSLRMSINLGGGPLDIVVGNGELNDRKWHKIEVIRRGTYCVLSLDDRMMKNGTTPGRNSKFDLQHVLHGIPHEKMYFAGHDKPRELSISRSKQNFAGCMQHVFYNEVNILFRKFHVRNMQLSSVGYVQQGCPVVTTTETPITTTAAPNPKVVTKLKTSQGPAVVLNGNFGSQNSESSKAEPLSKSQIAWITSGIIIGALVLVFTTACLVHRCKRRYDGFLISSALKNKDNQPRPNQRYKGERVVFLEHGTKKELEKVTTF